MCYLRTIIIMVGTVILRNTIEFRKSFLNPRHKHRVSKTAHDINIEGRRHWPALNTPDRTTKSGN